ncbi:MAG: hypothetical protein ABFD54_12400 [Armatimonadota bacterium]|nr:hypothetical protein [bacterium]
MSLFRNILFSICIVFLAEYGAAAGISGTFVKADTNNTSPASAIVAKDYADGYDSQWTPTAWGNVTALTSYAMFDIPNHYGEDCPQLTTTVNRLDPAKTYEVYVQFLACYGGNWAIYANLPGQPRALLTISNATPTGVTYDGSNPICEYMLGTVSGVTSLSVNVDDYHDSTAYALSVYYGVSYKEVDTPSGITGTFIKADTTNTIPVNAIVAKNYADGYDAKWTPMPWGNVTALTSYAKFDPANNLGENCPLLTTTVRGLDSAKTYDVYVQFLALLDGNWAIYAALSGQPRTLARLANSAKTGITFDGTNPICEFKVGTIRGMSSFSVNVDDYYDSPVYALSLYYGVSYMESTQVSPYYP